jgi:AraC-like DNA-binding protein
MNQTTAAMEPAYFRFSTADWPEAQRRGAVTDIYARTIMRYEIAFASEESPQIEASFLNLPGLGFASVSSSAASARRARKHLTSDDVALNIGLSGTRSVVQWGREAVTHCGGAVLTSAGETAAATISASHYLTFRVPLKTMAALVPDLEDRIARSIPAETEALRLLVGYATALQDRGAMAAPELRRLAVTHVHDLMALTLGAARDVAEVAKLRGARAARFRAVTADIADHLGSELSIADVAARQRLPVRYLQRLFESEGTTFTELVLAARLARAHGLLSDPRLADRPISTIAFDVGFGTLSYFNQTFRRRFGISPSDLRAQARRGN